MERVMGIEPTPSAWKAEVLPLNYTRLALPDAAEVWRYPGPTNTFIALSEGFWWRGKDSNLRRLSQQIYSLPPLTAREPLQNPESRILMFDPALVNYRCEVFCWWRAVRRQIVYADSQA